MFAGACPRRKHAERGRLHPDVRGRVGVSFNLASLFVAKSIDVSVRKNLFFTQYNYRVKMSGQNVLSDNRCLKLYNKEK